MHIHVNDHKVMEQIFVIQFAGVGLKEGEG